MSVVVYRVVTSSRFGPILEGELQSQPAIFKVWNSSRAEDCREMGQELRVLRMLRSKGEDVVQSLVRAVSIEGDICMEWPHSPETRAVALEMCNRGDLLDVLMTRAVDPKDGAGFLLDVARGLDFLHGELSVAHLDVSAENIGLHESSGGIWKARLMDYGQSASFDDDGHHVSILTAQIGKPAYIGIERGYATADARLAREEVTRFAGAAEDAWGLGVVAFMVATRRQPFTPKIFQRPSPTREHVRREGFADVHVERESARWLLESSARLLNYNAIDGASIEDCALGSITGEVKISFQDVP